MAFDQNGWQGKRVLIIGIARQGIALAEYLLRQGARVVLNDRGPLENFAGVQERFAGQPVEWVCGAHPLHLLDETALVCPSGGVPLDLPLLKEARQRGIPFSNDSQVFLEAAPCPVIGITGSAGKTTTTTLVGRMADALYKKNTWVGGNIGNPLIQNVEAMKPEDLAVMELSSFQLDVMHTSPQVAVILNITPNHLDRHKTMQAYSRAKANILRYQQPEDTAVLSNEDPATWQQREHVQGNLVTFGWQPPQDELPGAFLEDDHIVWRSEAGSQVVMHRDAVLLKGSHNLLNVLAACAVAGAAGLPTTVMQQGVQDFRGVPHRLELVRFWRGAGWYNDSIATAPERAMAAIRAFDEPLVLLAGGKDKDLDWSEFARLIALRVRHLLAFGETAKMLAGLVREQAHETSFPQVEVFHTMENALERAAQVVSPGDVVLLSPGGTSFDAYKDFAERGERFREWLTQQI